MKMLRAVEFLVPRRPDTGAGTPTSAISPLLPQTDGSPRFCASPQAAPNFVRDADQDTIPWLPVIFIGSRPRHLLVPWDATQCMGRSSWVRWLPCGDGQWLPP